MTQYFEVHERDAAARLGEFRLAEPLATPALVDDRLADAGSRWSADREVPAGGDEPAGEDAVAGSEAALTVLPHRGFPAGTEPEVQSSFRPEFPEVDYPSAAVVAPETAADLGQDAYVLSNAQGIVGHAAAFVETILGTREAIPADTALYLPGVATPGNVATLAYAGVDLLDADRAAIAGTRGRYLTTDGERDLDALREADAELPCACAACAGTTAEELTREDCVEHNVATLRGEVARVRRRIREGTLRDYLEGQARHEQWHTAVFRRLDRQWSYLEQRTPLVRTAEITAATDDALRRVEIQRFAERVTSRFRPRLDSHPLVLVPCSAHKPYSDSQSHGQFQRAIQYRGHVVSITSPIGVVPAELELTYPAQHYDAVVTGDWSATEVEFVGDVLDAYLERADYPRVVAHVPGDYRPIVERATAERDLDVEYTVADHPTTGESLSNLGSALEGELKYSRGKRYRSIARGLADYMLGDDTGEGAGEGTGEGAGSGADENAGGDGAGDALFDDVEVHGRYPHLKVDAASETGLGDGDPLAGAGAGGEPIPGGTQLAAVVPQYGVLSLTMPGARLWAASDAPAKYVEIDDFVPSGSVLAPGVVAADEAIRAGEEVLVDGPSAFAVGRAAMSGPEMAESTRGVAVEVRHVAER